MTEYAPSAANLKLARPIIAGWRPPTDEQVDRIMAMLGSGREIAEVVGQT